MKKILLFITALILSKFTFALNPVREYAVTPADYGMDYKEVIITAADFRKDILDNYINWYYNCCFHPGKN